MQHDFSDRGETRRVCERAGQMLGDCVQALCSGLLFTIAEEKATCEITKDESAGCPVPLEDQNDRRIGLTCEADERPVSISRSPQLHSKTRSGAHTVERMGPTVGVNGNWRFGRGLRSDHPGPAAFASNRNLGAYDLSNQAYKVLQKLPWPVLGIDAFTHFEQSTTLLAAKAPTAGPGLIG